MIEQRDWNNKHYNNINKPHINKIKILSDVFNITADKIINIENNADGDIQKLDRIYDVDYLINDVGVDFKLNEIKKNYTDKFYLRSKSLLYDDCPYIRLKVILYYNEKDGDYILVKYHDMQMLLKLMYLTISSNKNNDLHLYKYLHKLNVYMQNNNITFNRANNNELMKNLKQDITLNQSDEKYILAERFTFNSFTIFKRIVKWIMIINRGVLKDG